MNDVGKSWSKKDTGKTFNHIVGSQEKEYVKKSQGTTRYPTSILRFDRPKQNGVHPTQKPVGLFEWLIKTYTNEGELVLDNCIGSGTTAVAAINTGRNFIGIEREEEYVKIASQRVADAIKAKAGE